jgi:hypothetical protein
MFVCARIAVQNRWLCFSRKSDGFLRSYCRKCHNKRATAARIRKMGRTGWLAYQKRLSVARRKNPDFLARTVLQDCKKSDRKLGRVCDLHISDVERMVCGCCSYCGDSSIRMTLDRIDNDLGHVRGNVLPSCIRCNLIRGSMPMAAWMHLVPSIREARELGLFGLWRSKPIRALL